MTMRAIVLVGEKSKCTEKEWWKHPGRIAIVALNGDLGSVNAKINEESYEMTTVFTTLLFYVKGKKISTTS